MTEQSCFMTEYNSDTEQSHEFKSLFADFKTKQTRSANTGGLHNSTKRERDNLAMTQQVDSFLFGLF